MAALGTAFGTNHIQLLSKHTRKIVFCFDGDNAGHEAAWRALECCLPYLNNDLEVSFIFLPKEHDPDSFIRAEGSERFLQCVSQASPLCDFFLNTLCEGINLHQLAGKNQFMQAAKPYLQRIPNGPFRQLLLNELSRLTHVENHRIEAITQLQSDKEANNAPPSFSPETLQRTPARLAIAILLQNPTIFQSCRSLINEIELGGEEGEILPLLIKKMTEVPNITTAVLIEAGRNLAFFDALKQLAYWDHQIPEEKLQNEFIDILNFLKKQSLEKKINEYIAKSRKQGLTDSERLFLQNLLKERHPTN